MNIIKSAFFGFLLVVAACVLLFWAEGRAVKTARSLDEGSGLVIEVEAGRIDPANDGKLVHVSGAVVPEDVPSDTRLGISAAGSVWLGRRVEMFQWKEIRREVERTGNDGKTSKATVYDYEKVWSETSIDSTGFKSASAPSNPEMRLKSDDFSVGTVRIGAFRLAGSDVARLGVVSSLSLTDTGAAGVMSAIGGNGLVWLIDNRYVLARDPDAPEIGDLRIGYRRGDLDAASAVGAQSGDRLSRFTTSNGRELFLIQSGKVPAAEMFKDAMAGNTVLTWVIRIGGLGLMFAGFMLTFKLITGIAGSIPVIGGLIRTGTALVAITLTLATGSIVIAAGWVFYRPLLALVIIAGGVGLAVALGVLGQKTAKTVET